MAYTAWSVVFGEQPTAAKWNQLGANDAGFKDGTNIDNLAITNAKLAGSISGDKLATNAILLGKTNITATINTTSTSPVQAGGLTQTVTVPAGGRSVLILVHLSFLYNSTGGSRGDVTIWDGAVGSGTQLAQGHGTNANSASAQSVDMFAIQTPAAGSKTYNVGYSVNPNGTATIEAGATTPSTIAVLLI